MASEPSAGIYLSHPSSHEHDTGAHPENANRLAAIEAALGQRDWAGLRRLEAPAASTAQLARVHTDEHIEGIAGICRDGGGMIDLDTVASSGSYVAALHAAGGAADGAARLLAGEAPFAFCGLRPPGHHAEGARAMGFCLFNNVAVAAAHALAECGASRVAILDWDVHHGNGTEEIFARSSDVLYCSIHQWPLYPGTGAADYTGEGPGEGYTLNLPVGPGAGSDEFIDLVEDAFAPRAREHAPDLLAISAGYDAHRDDPLASCVVDTDAYGGMAAIVRALGEELGAPVLVCLEGGYSPAALAGSVIATIEALAGTRPKASAGP